jgi:hypothetical protein
MLSEDEQYVLKHMLNRDWRLSNLYKIKDKSTNVVTFKPNAVQKDFLANVNHKRLVVPKARQHGITTCASIYFLDACLTKPNQRAAIIAHRESDARKIFASKIKFPIQNLDKDFAAILPKVTRITNDLVEFENGSTIYAATMVRSDTLSHLHISELGKMAAWYPVKAEEVRTGAFPAAEKGQIIIESTMEGNYGLLAEISNSAYRAQELGDELAEKDFKLLFYPWYQSKDYQSNEVQKLNDLDAELVDYFCDLEESGIKLTDQQKAWYVTEHNLLGWRMKQEYPSSYQESISNANEASFFGRYIAKARAEGRICHLPHDTHARTFASFDIGVGDQTAIWVFQLIGKEIHFVDFMQCEDSHIGHYMSWLARKPYEIDRIVLPHDARAREKSSLRTYQDYVEQDFHYKTIVLERDAHEILGVECAWSTFPSCFFDKKLCAEGIESLTFFSRQYDRTHDRYLGKSVHDKHSDAAKSFIYACESVPRLREATDDLSLKEYREFKARHRKPIFR